MKIRHYEDMNLQELDVMKEIGSIGTSHAATSLSKLLQKEIRITLPEISVLGYEEAIGRIGNPEEIATGVLVKMDGQINGLMLFLFNADFAHVILDKLMGKSCKDFTELDEIGYSALVEVGNIIICSYVNAFSKLVGVDINLSVPSATVNMLGGILTVPIAEYGYETDKLMYFNADFLMEGQKLPGWLLMLPDIRSLNDILEKLGVC